MSDRYSPVRSHGSPTRLWARLTRRRAEPNPPADGMALAAVPIRVPADLSLLTPTMRVVVVEDACWALAMDALWSNRPPVWRRAAREAWAAERATLNAKRDRLRAMVADDRPSWN